jgi:hypothetical protein
VIGLFRKAIREEAAGVAKQLAEVRGLAYQSNRRLRRLEDDVAAERGARVDDVALLVDLVAEGWKSIDARLARIEQQLAAQPPLREVA